MPKEKQFQQELGHSIREAYPEAFFYKIPDVGRSQERFAPVRPFDCFFVLRSTFFALELKLEKAFSPLNHKKVHPHQIEALMKVCHSGGRSFLVINYRNNNLSSGMQKREGYVGKKKVNLALFIQPLVYRKALESYPQDSSISFHTLMTMADYCISRSKGAWDVGFIKDLV